MAGGNVRFLSALPGSEQCHAITHEKHSKPVCVFGRRGVFDLVFVVSLGFPGAEDENEDDDEDDCVSSIGTE
jgi:hypothetical protein